jgi:folylpolyglutamate synthase/dihydropteroate synthase
LVQARKYIKKGAQIEIFLDSETALNVALERAQKDDLVLGTGSFFLAGELRKHWFPEEYVLKNRKNL